MFTYVYLGLLTYVYPRQLVLYICLLLFTYVYSC